MGNCIAAAALLYLLACLLSGCGGPEAADAEVVVYTSVDQIHASKVFEQFSARTGIRVAPVFDTEAAKTTGLYGRLLSERKRPRADVFWNGEICRTIQLAQAGLAADLRDLVPDDLPKKWVDPNGRWAAFSLRARIIIYNTKMLDESRAPRSLEELTRAEWRGKFAMANPLFGTTATHTAALYEVLGEAKAGALMRSLKANGARVVEGNSVVRDLVARGEVPAGLTDTDDFFAGLLDGKPVGCVIPDQDGLGAFLIPNSVMLVAGGPNPQAARELVMFLLDVQLEKTLAFSRARQIPVRIAAQRPHDLERFNGIRALEVDYNRVAARMREVSRRMEEIFLR